MPQDGLRSREPLGAPRRSSDSPLCFVLALRLLEQPSSGALRFASPGVVISVPSSPAWCSRFASLRRLLYAKRSSFASTAARFLAAAIKAPLVPRRALRRMKNACRARAPAPRRALPQRAYAGRGPRAKCAPSSGPARATGAPAGRARGSRPAGMRSKSAGCRRSRRRRRGR